MVSFDFSLALLAPHPGRARTDTFNGLYSPLMLFLALVLTYICHMWAGACTQLTVIVRLGSVARGDPLNG